MMPDPEPYAPRQFNPNEVLVPAAARDSFARLLHFGGGVLWLCAGFTLAHAAASWETSAPATWLASTGSIAASVWMPILGSVILLQNLGESLTRVRQRWLSLMSWMLLGWGLLLLALVGTCGLASSRIYQAETEAHSAAEVARSERFQQLRATLQNTSDASEMKRLTLAAGVSIPPSEPLPEAPRVLREHLVNLIGSQEDKLDQAALKKLQEEHSRTLFSGLAHVCAAIAAAAVSLVAWARSGWIRSLGD